LEEIANDHGNPTSKWDYQFGRHNPNVMDIAGSQESATWKKIWRLQITSKFNFFGCRVLHGLIPYLSFGK
jgi:hypothetical protein